jgi:hypothetical protein
MVTGILESFLIFQTPAVDNCRRFFILGLPFRPVENYAIFDVAGSFFLFFQFQ